jgi:hypothetical protein
LDLDQPQLLLLNVSAHPRLGLGVCKQVIKLARIETAQSILSLPKVAL